MNAPQQAAQTTLPGAMVVATMSSMEIVSVINEERKADAEAVSTRFVALRHDNFLVKIEKHPGIDSPKFLGEYKDGTGRAVKCYHLPKREAELMVMSESLKVQTRVYDRLMEQEAAAALSRNSGGALATPDFEDPVAMARAWADAKEAAREEAVRANHEAAKAAQLEHQVAELAPAAAGLDRIANADDAMCVTDAAKTLQLAPHKLRDLLLEKKWLYPRVGKRGHVAYQDKIHAGYLKHKYGNYQDPESGEWKTSAQVLVTSKGIAKLSKMLSPPAPPSPDQRQLN